MQSSHKKYDNPVTPFAHMQAAVDIVGSSPHPENKVAATVFTDDYSVSSTNHWPEIIAERIGTGDKIGNSSGTIHAETESILKAPKTEGASICITDPFCPNCAKNIAEAGIKTIYIDHKGFDKDFFARRSDHFDTMSMQICEKAGISVYELWREDKKLEPIYEAPKDYEPFEESPIQVHNVTVIDDDALTGFVRLAAEQYERRKFSLAFAQNDTSKTFCLIGRSHPIIGLCMKEDEDLQIFERPQGKYSFIQEPVNRLLMNIKRRGMRPLDGYFYCSQVPTAREQVNFVGAGLTRLTVGDSQRARDTHALEAMQLLQNHKILLYS